MTAPAQQKPAPQPAAASGADAVRAAGLSEAQARFDRVAAAALERRLAS